MNLARGYSALRAGRWSEAHAQYFVSFCTRGRRAGLHAPALTTEMIGRFAAVERRGFWQVRTGSVMPDHVHLLVRLAESADLGGAMRELKGPLTPALRRAGLAWQEGFHEHRLRSDDEVLPVFRYIFLNAYEAGLLPTAEKWPGYVCCAEDWAWFRELTQDERPYPEWLRGWQVGPRRVGA